MARVRAGEPAPHLVIIGSSAGGIEALTRVVATLPTDFPAPIVIAQHLDPRRQSHMVEILGRHTDLPIRIVDGSTRLEDGVLFVIPPNRTAEIVDGAFRLGEATPGTVAPSIDRLFSSGATAYGERLTAVVLTGTGSDGSAGAWEVKQAGGSVVIENPATAMFGSMPASVSPSLVDASVDLDAIGAVLVALVDRRDGPLDDSDPTAIGEILDRIRERSGIDLSDYKSATIVRRLRGRMNATGSATIQDYGTLIDGDAAEYDRLVSSLLIKVTEFFRDPTVWAHLRDEVLPGLVDDAHSDARELRVWSAGCSTGEEAYSIAMMLAEIQRDDRRPMAVRIFATDVDGPTIAFARRGIYPPGAIAKVPAEMRDRYLLRTTHGYEVVKRLRSQIIFGEHDLSSRVPFPRIDLLVCRNVLIYFTTPLQRTALETFAFSLRPDGVLVLGLSETVASFAQSYAESNGRFRIYRRLPGHQIVPHAWPKVVPTTRDPAAPLNRTIDATRSDGRPTGGAGASADPILMGLEVGLVVVDARYDIIRINTAARRALGIHGVAFDQDFVHLADTLPSTGMRDAIDAALKGKSSRAVYEVEGVNVATDAPVHLEASVRPYRTDDGSIAGAVIELADVSRIERERITHGRMRQRLDKAAALNERLLRANDELSALVVDLREANITLLRSSEDAQVGREELETLNEEFQATNEELETLNEELTATVEELRIANEDLAARTEESRLQAVAIDSQKRETEEEHDRLRSILSSIGDAVFAVDPEGRMVATNIVYDRLFGSPEALERLEDVAGLPFAPKDRPQSRAARGERFRVEFALAGPDGHRRWYEAVAEPLTAEDRTWGGVVSIRDISERTMRLSLERLMAAAAHELKTPTAAIHNYLQLVERRLVAGQPDEAATYTVRAVVQARRLNELVERLFDVSRIQTGQLSIVAEPTDLVTIVRDAVDVAGARPEAPAIRFDAKPASLRISGDAGRLTQVFLNLLTNAIEHGYGSEGIDVAVRRAGRHAVVEIRDHGHGIPAEDLGLLFEAYTRLGQRPPETGLGLGLFVAREIVAAHGGTITATSEVGTGTTFTVRLPAGGSSRAPAASRATTLSGQASRAPTPARPKKPRPVA